MLDMVIRRHWKLYGHHIESMLRGTGANQGPLMNLVQRLKVLSSTTFMPVVTSVCSLRMRRLNFLCGAAWRALQREEDGMQKCAIWCRILKTMCDSKLEDLQAQVWLARTTASITNTCADAFLT